MTEDPRIDLVALREYAESDLYDGDTDQGLAGYTQLLDAADEIMSLRSRLQAALARAEAAEASLKAAEHQLDVANQCIEQTICIIEIGSTLDPEHTLGLLMEHLDDWPGGTSPEPTEMDLTNACRFDIGPKDVEDAVCKEHDRRWPCEMGDPAPVDVASEPPNPPQIVDRGVGNYSARYGWPVGEPLKPTEQEQQ